MVKLQNALLHYSSNTHEQIQIGFEYFSALIEHESKHSSNSLTYTNGILRCQALCSIHMRRMKTLCSEWCVKRKKRNANKEKVHFVFK